MLTAETTLILCPLQHPSNSKIAGCELLKMVARDGLEAPTPAFSGLLTDNAKRFGIKASLCPRAGCKIIQLGSIGMV